VLGDLTRLAQVLTNLLNNASKFSGPGQPISLIAEASEHEVTCRVTDEGAGITADELPTIFDMFAQGADRMQQARGGLGVGLALVRQLVEMHGGMVRADSAGRGKGSTFTFVLPRVPAPAARTVADRQPEMMQTMKRVLVVDDNADSAESLSLLLELMGHTVRTAHDGEEALEQAETFRPELVLMDIGMPRMDGYEAARRLRQLPWAGEVVIVALTGWGQDEDKRRSEEAGFDRHLIKPVDPTALEALLGQAAQ
jgi:CheY-like chemotaxis protein